MEQQNSLISSLPFETETSTKITIKITHAEPTNNTQKMAIKTSKTHPPTTSITNKPVSILMGPRIKFTKMPSKVFLEEPKSKKTSSSDQEDQAISPVSPEEFNTHNDSKMNNFTLASQLNTETEDVAKEENEFYVHERESPILDKIFPQNQNIEEEFDQNDISEANISLINYDDEEDIREKGMNLKPLWGHTEKKRKKSILKNSPIKDKFEEFEDPKISKNVKFNQEVIVKPIPMRLRKQI